MRAAARIAALAAVLGGPAVAQTVAPLALPDNARATGARAAALADLALPIGPWRAGEVAALEVEGALSQTAWQVPADDVASLDLMIALRKQVEAEGYDILFECRARGCGGFDFRYALDVLPEPEMHVDLADFRFLSARRGEGAGADYLALLVSRAADTGFVQVTQVTPRGETPREPAVVLSSRTAPQGVAAPAPTGEGDDIAAALETGGALALDDLVFATGAVALGPGPFASLDRLAGYLRAHPDRRVTLVGHSDAEGGLAGNIALSRRRAEAVRAVLIEDYAIPAAQVTAEGVGYLAPRASNLDDDGRRLNRRVEAVLSAIE